jgi:hypothetical protein
MEIPEHEGVSGKALLRKTDEVCRCLSVFISQLEAKTILLSNYPSEHLLIAEESFRIASSLDKVIVRPQIAENDDGVYSNSLKCWLDIIFARRGAIELLNYCIGTENTENIPLSHAIIAYVEERSDTEWWPLGQVEFCSNLRSTLEELNFSDWASRISTDLGLYSCERLISFAEAIFKTLFEGRVLTNYDKYDETNLTVEVEILDGALRSYCFAGQYLLHAMLMPNLLRTRFAPEKYCLDCIPAWEYLLSLQVVRPFRSDS